MKHLKQSVPYIVSIALSFVVTVFIAGRTLEAIEKTQTTLCEKVEILENQQRHLPDTAATLNEIKIMFARQDIRLQAIEKEMAGLKTTVDLLVSGKIKMEDSK